MLREQRGLVQASVGCHFTIAFIAANSIFSVLPKKLFADSFRFIDSTIVLSVSSQCRDGGGQL